ncbi:MAG: cyclase family protein [Thermoplasmata archaeon]
MRRIDISMPLRAGMAAFPGDPPFGSAPTHSLDAGDAYNVSALAFGSHAGTHVDPPRHFLEEGLSIDRIDLGALNGPCVVVGVDPRHTVVGPAEVAGVPEGTERVLFRTSNSARWRVSGAFFPDYVALTVAAADALIARKVRLVGIDSLSVELDPLGKFPVHHRLLGYGTLILEGLELADAPPGPYELECLPLRLEDGDGGPARAVLLTP